MKLVFFFKLRKSHEQYTIADYRSINFDLLSEDDITQLSKNNKLKFITIWNNRNESKLLLDGKIDF